MRRLVEFRDHGFDAQTAQENLRNAFRGVAADAVLDVMEVARGFLGQSPEERNEHAFVTEVFGKVKKGDITTAHRQALTLIDAYRTNQETWDARLEERKPRLRPKQ